MNSTDSKIIQMELINYIGLKVKILLVNNYYYIGNVISADSEGLDLRDIKGQFVSLRKELISSIQEVSQ